MYAPGKTDPKIEAPRSDGFVGRLVDRYGQQAADLFDRAQERFKRVLPK